MEQPQKSMIDTLTGSFLLSTPQMPDPRFAEQVIYICSHSDEGAVGIAVNKPEPDLTLDEVLRSSGLPVPAELDTSVYIGGPVEPNAAFILYTSDYVTEQQLEVSPTVSLSRNNKVLEDIAHGRGPEKFLFAIGYAGWGPGQLEQELVSQGWLTIPADESIIFDVPDTEKWRRAASLYGIDIAIFQDFVGNA
ncbi:MAG: YqgE/AlgH family protein [Desulfocapsa sp.]|nr:YqgE/AlgH family protein [Desulfocapsa sp.]